MNRWNKLWEEAALNELREYNHSTRRYDLVPDKMIASKDWLEAVKATGDALANGEKLPLCAECLGLKNEEIQPNCYTCELTNWRKRPMSDKYRLSGYIKTLLALTSLTIAGAFFSLLRSPKAFSYLTIGCWLVLNIKFGYKQWMNGEDDCYTEMSWT